ncbi:MAG: cytidylate kinase-like family protein [Eubacteriales bacterium]|nr:cytidylate kinase-like family protein [Eubacteriales bacterium]
MSCNSIITIGRQYGSGGREIGEKLAKALEIPFYDNELLDRAAKDSGLAQELFENHDEKPTNSFLYSLVMDTYTMGYSAAALSGMPINHKVFLAQFNAIKKIADEGPCVMVGRCADYALEEYPNCIKIFIYGDKKARIQRIMKRRDLSEAKAKEAISKTDKQRASYYNYYTNKRWGEIGSYDLCIDSGMLGIDGTASLIVDYVRQTEMHRK